MRLKMVKNEKHAIDHRLVQQVKKQGAAPHGGKQRQADPCAGFFRAQVKEEIPREKQKNQGKKEK